MPWGIPDCGSIELLLDRDTDIVQEMTRDCRISTGDDQRLRT
ncbi:unnamed protein product [Staurois parvus]|uniref:Uncharacterized protein n=1 Tax=Staurois parvus TaxID=386267 RepID=A0ABN9BXR7_9NEOB|nr:unnamed protein product [Staurois parvus]